MRQKLLLSGALAAAALIGVSLWAQRRSAVEKKDAQILALGDSYTIGEGVAESERWPSQLAKALRKEGFSIATPKVIARTGWTTGDLLAATNSVDLPKSYDVVTLLIGVNDQFRWGGAEAYRPEFRQMLQRAIHFAGGKKNRVIVISIPDWGITPFAKGRDPEAIAAAIAQFNAVNRDESAKADVRYVDITPVSRVAAREPALLVADGLHPSAGMYARWSALILPSAKEVLLEPPKN